MPLRPVIRHRGQRPFARFATSSLSMASAIACARSVETISRPPADSSERASRKKGKHKASSAATWSHCWLYACLFFLGFRQFIHRAQTAGTDNGSSRRIVHNHMPALYIEYKPPTQTDRYVKQHTALHE